MTDQIDPEDLAADANAGFQPPGLIEEIYNVARNAFVTEYEIKDLEEKLKRKKKEYDGITTRILPSLMDQARLRSLTIEANANFPAFTVEVKTAYNANIAAGWDEERRKAAFDWLEEHGHGSLIKTDVTTHFNRNEREGVAAFIAALSESGVNYRVKEAVHSQTLSSWLREMVEAGRPLPPLDVIGGYVERQAVIKEEHE